MPTRFRRRLLPLFLLASAAPAAERYDWLIQGAVDTELQPLLNALENKKQIHLRAWTFWTGRIAGQRVAISRTEVGHMNATASTVIGIERFRPRAIINQGTAGAQQRELNLWDVVIGEKTVDYAAVRTAQAPAGSGVDPKRWTPLYHRLRLQPGAPPQPFPAFPGHPALVEWAAAAGVNPRGQVRKGVIGSAYEFNREIDLLNWAHATHGTDTEDMESVYAAAVAAAYNVPFVAIRMVSDSEWKHPTFERITGNHCAEFVLDLIRRAGPRALRSLR